MAKRPSALQWQFFYQQLHHLLVSGLPLMEALALLSQHTQAEGLADVCAYLSHCVWRGQSLAAAAAACQAFDAIDLSLLEVGELSGRLANSVWFLAKHHQRRQQFKHGLHKALAYPLAIVLMSVLVLWFMLVWLVPQFSQLFASVGAPLPWLTRALLSVAQHAMAMAGMSFLLLILLAGLVRYLWLHQRSSVEWYGQRLWFWGSLWRLSVWQRFCQSLALMLSAGVPLLQALPVSAKASASVLCEVAMRLASYDIQRGMALHMAFAKQDFFADDFIALLVVGENSGRLDAVLLQQASWLEQQLADRVEYLQRWLEPMIMIVVGILVGFMLVALYLPMFDMGKMV